MYMVSSANAHNSRP